MKTCSHCQQPIPARIIVDGQEKKTIWGRKFCYECNPFGSKIRTPIAFRNTPAGQKFCTDCKTLKSLEDFAGKPHGKKQAYCRTCAMVRQKAAHWKRKQECVDRKGGKCQLCGYKKCLTSLQFHHIDPTEKSFELGFARSFSWESVVRELNKCVLLCSNCHGEVHEGKTKLPLLAGSGSIADAPV